MTRAAAFETLRTHAWHGKVFAKLKKSEVEQCQTFLRENESLDIVTYEQKVQRMFLDQSEKPKNWTVMNELLISAGIIQHQAQQRSP